MSGSLGASSVTCGAVGVTVWMRENDGPIWWPQSALARSRFAFDPLYNITRHAPARLPLLLLTVPSSLKARTRRCKLRNNSPNPRSNTSLKMLKLPADMQLLILDYVSHAAVVPCLRRRSCVATRTPLRHLVSIVADTISF